MTLPQPDQDSIFTLSQFSLIEINGPDSEKFLQGQLTCDISQIENHTWILGACCTAKGRMVANFIIARIDDYFYLRVSATVAETLINHLKKYAVFFKTQLQVSARQPMGFMAAQQLELGKQLDLGKKLITADLAVYGGAVSFDISSDCQQLQAAVNDSEQQVLTINWPDGRQEYWLKPLATQLPQQSSSTAGIAWQQADIFAGLYWVDKQQSDQWIPQQIAWDQLGGVSFNKGCYTGQEIIARLQYLGKSKKIIAVITLDQPLKQSTEQTLDQPFKQSTEQSVDQSTEQSNEQSRKNQTVTITKDGDRPVATLLTWSGHCGLAIANYSDATKVQLTTEQGQTYGATLLPLLAPQSDNSGD